MPSSSARFTQLPRAIDKAPFYEALKKFRDYLNGKIDSVEESEVTFPDLNLKVIPKAERLAMQQKIALGELPDIKPQDIKQEANPATKQKPEPKRRGRKRKSDLVVQQGKESCPASVANISHSTIPVSNIKIEPETCEVGQSNTMNSSHNPGTSCTVASPMGNATLEGGVKQESPTDWAQYGQLQMQGFHPQQNNSHGYASNLNGHGHYGNVQSHYFQSNQLGFNPPSHYSSHSSETNNQGNGAVQIPPYSNGQALQNQGPPGESSG